jgi:hypothetical protein
MTQIGRIIKAIVAEAIVAMPIAAMKIAQTNEQVIT